MSALERVRFLIMSAEITAEACKLLGAGICLRHQDTLCRLLALRKPVWGQGFAVSLEKCIENRSHGCARAPRPREVLGWNIGRKGSMADS